jgi:hypothetical protein
VVLLDESGSKLELETVNIEGNPELMVRYDLTVPVFQRMDTGAELFWPFDDDDLELFLEGLER